MKAIKKTITIILTVLACTALVLMCGERPDGSISLAWSLGWLAVLAGSVKILDKMGAFPDDETI